MILLTIFLVVALMIFLNGLYVGAEFATVGSRRTRVRQLAGSGDRRAQRLLPVLEDNVKLDEYVATCQLGITITSLVLGAFGERVIAEQVVENRLLSAAVASTVVLLTLTLLQVVLGELFPKSIAVLYPEQLALLSLYPVYLSQLFFKPLIWLFNGSGRLVLRLFGGPQADGHGRSPSPEEIEILVSESHEGGLLQDEERQFLRNAFRMAELTARQVMVHRTRLVAAELHAGTREVLNLALEAGFSRIPVYERSIDNIVGFVHIKDVFRLHTTGQNDSIAPIVRQVVYVPEALPAVDVWEQLKAQRQYMAVVFDEYGGTAGLITLEDLIEEIVGELQDEFDNEDALVKLDQSGRVHLRADLLVSDVNEYFELSLPEESADTIGGLIFSELGRRPNVGDEVEVAGVVLRVEALEDLGVSEVSIPAQAGQSWPQISEWEVDRD